MNVQRAAAIIGSAIFLVIASGTLAVYVPWHLTHWLFAPPLFPIARVLGAAPIVAGLPILLDSFARFALQGFGTVEPRSMLVAESELLSYFCRVVGAR